jgi:hypothetical protein
VRASVKFHLHKGRPLAKKVPVASSFSTGPTFFWVHWLQIRFCLWMGLLK